MTNPETKSQYEGAILNQLVQTVEKVAVVEVTVKQNSEKLDSLEQEFKGINTRLYSLDQRLISLDQRLINIESLLGWVKIIGSGVVAIALSLIANFIYSLLY